MSDRVNEAAVPLSEFIVLGA